MRGDARMIVTGKIALATSFVPVVGAWMVRTFC